jgi:ribosomal protein S18 acetylase RimI-like enzyme
MNEVVGLRIAHEDDVDAIRALTREAYAKWADLTGREPLPMRVDYLDAIRKHRFDLLYVGGRLVALIETVPEGDCLLIENVAVLPTFQGRGFGTRLLKLAEELAAASGSAGTRLYTNKLFLSNIRLYEALGYRVEREVELNAGVAVHMLKSRVRH